MHEQVSSRRGRLIPALRKILVEPVFGQIKGATGFRRFSLRGLQKVSSEWGIVWSGTRRRARVATDAPHRDWGVSGAGAQTYALQTPCLGSLMLRAAGEDDDSEQG